MSTPLIIIALVALAITAGGLVVTYQGLWKVWQRIPRDRRRRQIVWQVSGFTVGGAGLALLIIAPWGTKDTALYVFGGVCAFVILSVFVALAGAAIQHLIRSRRRVP